MPKIHHVFEFSLTTICKLSAAWSEQEKGQAEEKGNENNKNGS